MMKKLVCAVALMSALTVSASAPQLADVPTDVWKNGFGAQRHVLVAELASGAKFSRVEGQIAYVHGGFVTNTRSMNYQNACMNIGGQQYTINLNVNCEMTNQALIDALNRASRITRLQYLPDSRF